MKYANRPTVNVRSKAIMDQIEPIVLKRFYSDFLTSIRENNYELKLEHTHFLLAKEIGFCNGVRRSIFTAYATRAAYPDARIFLIGEIIHNPDVNRELAAMDIHSLPWHITSPAYNVLQPGDVVIVPAFGVPTDYVEFFKNKGVIVSDTTCGDVIKVWYQVRRYADAGITSVIHGKSTHEETLATASQARGKCGEGKYVIVFSLEDVRVLVDYIEGRGSKEEFLNRFAQAMSPGFDPDKDLQRIGISNQTTMLKSETLAIQEMLRQAIIARDGNDANCCISDTICGATQARQDALKELLGQHIDAVLVVGGYNSSNTTHLVEIASQEAPTYFIESADCIESLQQIRAYQLSSKREEMMVPISEFADTTRLLRLGITAGASCPSMVIDETLRKICALRGDVIPEA